MKIREFSYFAFYVFTFLFLILSYQHFRSIRLLVLIIILHLALVLFYYFEASKKSIFLLITSVPLLLVSTVFAIASQNVNSLSSILVFVYLALWTAFIKHDFKAEVEASVHDAYVFATLVSSFVVILQVYLYFFRGVEIFRVEEMGGRIAFSGMFTDFSALSVFIVSSVPMLISSHQGNRNIKVLLVLFLISGSILTTARAGFFALASVYVLKWFMSILFKHKFSFKVRPGRILGPGILISALIAFAIFFGKGVYERSEIFQDSSRLASYMMALEFFGQHPFVGALMSEEYYSSIAGFVPHNSVLYLFALGGLSLFFSSFLFFSLPIISALRMSNDLAASLLICFLGSLVVASPFSLYFVAVLLSLFYIKLKRVV